MELPFSGLATAIGSFPHIDSLSACQEVLLNLKDIPVWPQLPRRDFKENMYVQFSQGLPSVVIDEDKKTIHIEISDDIDREIEFVYQKYIDEDLEYFAMGPEYAAGFYELLKQIKEKNLSPKFIKGQVTGPISFGLSVTDQNKNATLYHPELYQVVIKALAMRSKWQVRKIKEVNPKVIIFIDEPYLTSIGSAYISLNAQEVISNLDEIIEAIHNEGAFAGIHCCGNTDWGLLTKTKVDIINFDAYDFGETISLYPDEINNFLERKGILAWGIVPTSSSLNKEDTETLFAKLEEQIVLLTKKGIEGKKIRKQLLITPSCGAATLSLELAHKAIKILSQLSERIKSSS